LASNKEKSSEGKSNLNLRVKLRDAPNSYDGLLMSSRSHRRSQTSNKAAISVTDIDVLKENFETDSLKQTNSSVEEESKVENFS
jgi:hypothetical protein